jgi:molybdopterin converting factor subunit 1
MRITTLLFAQAREHAGAAEQPLELPAGSRVSHALEALTAQHPQLAALLPVLAVAVDGVLARPDTALHEGAELALLPPVSGG